MNTLLLLIRPPLFMLLVLTLHLCSLSWSWFFYRRVLELSTCSRSFILWMKLYISKLFWIEIYIHGEASPISIHLNEAPSFLPDSYLKFVLTINYETFPVGQIKFLHKWLQRFPTSIFYGSSFFRTHGKKKGLWIPFVSTN